MTRDIKTQHRVLAGEALFFAPRRCVAQFEMNLGLGRGAASKEQTVLTGFLGAGGTADEAGAAAPLQAARDAVVIDSTKMGEDEVLERVEELAREKLGG